MSTDITFRNPPHDRVFGVEIECFTESMVSKKHHGFFYAGDDGSLRHHMLYSVEFVSQPIPKEWLKREVYKLHRKFPWEHNDTCGVHVHVNSAWCTKKKAVKIQKFLTSVDDTTIQFLFGREPNRFCRNVATDLSRYTQVNLTNESTIEFRMFRSGDPAWVCYCLDMVEYLVKNYNRLNIDALTAFRMLHQV